MGAMPTSIHHNCQWVPGWRMEPAHASLVSPSLAVEVIGSNTRPVRRVVRFPFAATDSNELSLSVGQLVDVLLGPSHSSGWVYGCRTNDRTASGWFPLGFTTYSSCVYTVMPMIPYPNVAGQQEQTRKFTAESNRRQRFGIADLAKDCTDGELSVECTVCSSLTDATAPFIDPLSRAGEVAFQCTAVECSAHTTALDASDWHVHARETPNMKEIVSYMPFSTGTASAAKINRHAAVMRQLSMHP